MTFIWSLNGVSENLNCNTSEILRPVEYIKYIIARSLLCCHVFQFLLPFDWSGSINFKKSINSSSLKVLFEGLKKPTESKKNPVLSEELKKQLSATLKKIKSFYILQKIAY